MRKRPTADSVFIALQFCSSLLFTVVFTVNLLYHTTVVRMTALQLVLVGTILETTIFVFEIPTGVLADTKSRRLSVIVGYMLIGVGFLIEAAIPRFWAVALAQVVWGLGYTFTSGATEAWIADEVGEERAARAFLRGSQAAQAGALPAIILSVLVGQIAIRLPIAVGGAGMLGLALFLIVAMREDRFKPTPREERTTWSAMLRTVVDARQLVRRQPLLLLLLAIGLFFGAYSEGVDRLETIHLLSNFELPWLGRVGDVAWFGALQAVGLVLSLVATRLAERGADRIHGRRAGWVLGGMTALIVAALAGFGLARSPWLAVGCLWGLGVLRTVREPLYAAWFNSSIDDSQVRATLFSVRSQVDALGQIGGGPLVGLIGNRSVRAALVASALILLPALPLHIVASDRSPERGA